MSKYCKRCGSRLEDDALFCGRCGTKQDMDPAWEPEPEPETELEREPEPEPELGSEPEPQHEPGTAEKEVLTDNTAAAMDVPEEAAVTDAAKRRGKRRLAVGLCAGLGVVLLCAAVLLYFLLWGKNGGGEEPQEPGASEMSEQQDAGSGADGADSTAELSWEEAYGQILNDAIREFPDYPNTCGYLLYDIDGDGVPELFVKAGTCEADYEYRVYAAGGETGAELVGTLPGGHTSVCGIGEPNAFLLWMTHMGGETITRVVLEGGKLRTEDIFSEADVTEFHALKPLGQIELDYRGSLHRWYENPKEDNLGVLESRQEDRNSAAQSSAPEEKPADASSSEPEEQPAAEHTHSYGDWNDDRNGTHSRSCACGDKQTEGHTLNSGVMTREPTYCTEGLITYTCIVCGAAQTQTVPKLESPSTMDYADRRECMYCGHAEGTVNMVLEKGVEVDISFTCSACGEYNMRSITYTG